MGLDGLVEGGGMPDIPRKLLKAETEKTVSPTEAHGNRYVRRTRQVPLERRE